MGKLEAVSGWLYRRAENILAAMLAAMFIAFLLQIAFRYLTDLSTGWTNELSALMWVWLVLFGAAFVIRENEEIRFDLIYGVVGAKAKRVMLGLAALGLIALYATSLPQAVDYVTFMKVEKTAYLKFRFDWVFSIYVIFLVAMLARYLFLGWRIVFGSTPPAHVPPPDAEPEPRQ
jgi:TRAP-type C4-dicarboxylate transport system permease small subunit